MSKKEIKNDKIAVMGHRDGPDLPMDNSDWSVSGDVMWDAGRAVGARFNGSLDGFDVSGGVKSGEATVNVGQDRSQLSLRYANERVTGSVSYNVGTEQAKITGNFDSRGNLTGTGELRFKDTTINFSPNSIGASYDFGQGWRGTLTREFGGGVGVNFSGGSSFGSGSSFNLSLGATGSGGSWGVNAKFNLVVLTSM
ncbi:MULTISPECIES: hypothetical protein [Stenotrophomonas maltophilia group]|uniref:hypothetical protein n=1 Tax=Stenotrophomonas maltophilia group TaxID=995085 RepID=UPI000F67F7C6|nr:hypothetical protein [Stenotrophomonas maltophilia]RRU77249.1 hypothetical protein EGJ89_02175 [Stenotrophomonas maltophilia]